jgi:uncharacterized protein YgiM (DUF1202 family)
METMKKKPNASKGQVARLQLIILAVICLWWAVGGIISHAEGTGTVNKTVNIRSGAGTDYSVLGSAEAGKTIDIRGKATGSDGQTWYQVFMNAETVGYIRADFLDSVTGEIGDVAATASNTGAAGTTDPGTASGAATVTDMAPVGGLVTQDNARVRSQADGSGEMIGDPLPVNTAITVNGQTTDAEGTVWYRVELQTGDTTTTGYIRSDFLTLSGETAPETTEPAVEPETPAVPETKAYDTQLLEDATTGAYAWYLMDNDNNIQYKVDDLFEAVKANADNYTLLEKSRSTVGTQMIAIILLVILAGFLMLTATFLFFKLRDAKEEPFLHQAQKPQRPVARPRDEKKTEVKPGKLMQTVGGTAKQPVRQTTQNPTGRPAGNLQKPVGGGTRPIPGGSKPMKQGQAPQVPGRTPTKPSAAASQPVRTGEPIQTSVNRPAPAQRTQPQTGQQSPNWKSRNFMADDDEFEFEFLNWDGTDKRDR